jgi:hypothetical protein
LYFSTALFFYPEAKGTRELATAGKGSGSDGVVELQAERDLEMILDMAAAAKAVAKGNGLSAPGRQGQR